MKYLAMALVRLYQKWISPLKPPCCRFYPTCSAYALEAFRKRGFFVGLALTFWRILRCNPFCRPGLDPVPDRKAKYPKVPLSRNRERVQPQADSAVSTYPAPASDPKDNTTE